MREAIVTEDGHEARKRLANIAYKESENAYDEYSGYGVGAVLQIKRPHNRYVGYSAHNIRMSGVEHTMHAEQLAIFQSILDTQKIDGVSNLDVNLMMIVTTGDDIAINCGHCTQVLSSACNYYNTEPEDVTVIGAYMENKIEDLDDRSLYECTKTRRKTLDEMIGTTYVSNREK